MYISKASVFKAHTRGEAKWIRPNATPLILNYGSIQQIPPPPPAPSRPSDPKSDVAAQTIMIFKDEYNCNDMRGHTCDDTAVSYVPSRSEGLPLARQY